MQVKPMNAVTADDRKQAPRVIRSAPAPVNVDLTDILTRSFEEASKRRDIPEATYFKVHGFCGARHRLLVNTIVKNLPHARYLEIGVFKGATLCSAISDNDVHAVGVDNWSEFGNPENPTWQFASEFYRNLAACRSPGSKVTILEQDFRTAPIGAFGPFNLGFYDGSHAEHDQYDGARVVLKTLDPKAILMVDDWNWERVRNGTARALRDERVRVDLMFEVRTTEDDSLPQGAGFGGFSDWHNGVMVAVVSKQ